ncbi:MAG: N-6 DNA methylase [Lachnospiraceae bacterium]
MLLNQIFKNSNYDDTQFTDEEIVAIESRIFTKSVKGVEVPYVSCLIRNKDIKLTPEEAVRQLFLHKLLISYGYPADRIALESPIYFGREVKRADVVIWDKDRPTVPYIIVELKKPKLTDGKEQLKSYCNATGAPIGVWTNGTQISYYNRKDPNYFEDITDIPSAIQKLSDIVNEQFTYEDLKRVDKLQKEKKSLKDLILEIEDEVLANAGVDVFEEVFKLIYAKLYDELMAARDKTAFLRFRNNGCTDYELKQIITVLFDDAKKKWDGVFDTDSKIMLSPSHLAVCVASLQNVKLFNSNLDVVDDAFEYLMSKSSKGEKGQYFTPRYVIDMCVKMMNPKESEFVIDPAAGSAGFTVHTIFHVWNAIRDRKKLPRGDNFTAEQRSNDEIEYVQNKVFAIDFDEKAVRVARTLNLIAGDGQTNVLHLNTLDYSRWDEVTKQELWNDTYNQGFKKLKAIRPQGAKDYKEFAFDVLMANPPFAGDIKENQIISRYELGKNSGGKWQTKVGRDILFIERNLNFLKPGGRMAIVLPQGRFNNSSDKQIRDFIAERCRILAVVGLHGNTFKPHTGTKTSVLFVQKWDAKLCPKVDDYNIFFATMQESGKDNSGDKIYVTQEFAEIHDYTVTPHSVTKIKKDDFLKMYGSEDDTTLYYSDLHKKTITGSQFKEVAESEKKNFRMVKWVTTFKENLLDDHGHLVVQHDLFNHDGITQDGIAEAFVEFAKKEGLSFFR